MVQDELQARVLFERRHEQLCPTRKPGENWHAVSFGRSQKMIVATALEWFRIPRFWQVNAQSRRAHAGADSAYEHFGFWIPGIDASDIRESVRVQCDCSFGKGMITAHRPVRQDHPGPV